MALAAELRLWSGHLSSIGLPFCRTQEPSRKLITIWGRTEDIYHVYEPLFVLKNGILIYYDLILLSLDAVEAIISNVRVCTIHRF